jgi:hypothetical protein
MRRIRKMTCIAGYIDKEGNIFMGGDSIGVSDSDFSIVKDPKVFIKSNMIFGYSESFRMGQILKYDFNIPQHPKNKSDMEYLCSIFIPKLIKKFEEIEFKLDDDELLGSFIIGYNSHLYVVFSKTFQILESDKNFEAVGAGESYAKGAFYVMENYNVVASPIDKVHLALKASAEFCFVKEPFNILKLGVERKK